MWQLDDWVFFEPIRFKEKTKLERERVTENLILLNKKRERTIKARMCSNGNTQRAYILRKEAMIPTTESEAIITTGVIDAKHKRDVMLLDIPNEFLQR